MSRVYAYCRVSTQAQVDSGLGLEAQRTELNAYARARGLEIGHVFCDEGVSGSKPMAKRQAGYDLCRSITNGDALILRMDRGFRSATDAYTQIPKWIDQGVAVHLVDLGVDTSSIMGEFFYRVMAAFAEVERKRIAERTSAALQERRRQGKATTGRAAWGWEIVDDEGHVEPHPVMGLVAGEVWELVESGWSWGMAADHVNELGHVRPNGKAWTRSALHGALKKNSTPAEREALLQFWLRRAS